MEMSEASAGGKGKTEGVHALHAFLPGCEAALKVCLRL
jgi:hypothetical protein